MSCAEGFGLMGIGPRLRSFTLLLLVLARSGTAFAATQPINESEIWWPADHSARGGGLLARSDTTVNLSEGVATLSGDKTVGFVRWFPATRLIPSSAGEAWKGKLIFLELKSSVSGTVSIGAAWRFAGPSGAAPHVGDFTETTVTLQANASTPVTVPLPSWPAGNDVDGVAVVIKSGGHFELARMSLGDPSSLSLRASFEKGQRVLQKIDFSGEALTPQASLEIKGPSNFDKKWPLTVHNSNFSITIPTESLPSNQWITATALGVQGNNLLSSSPLTIFVRPSEGTRQCPKVTRDGQRLMADGKPFGFVGLNYNRFQQNFSSVLDYQTLAEDVDRLAGLGVRVVRMPLNFALFEPAEGVFPDSPTYGAVMRAGHLDPGVIDEIDYFVALAGDRGIYTIIDWHGSGPADPFAPALGPYSHEKKQSLPGSPLAWLAPNLQTKAELDFSKAKDRNAIIAVHRWTAAHFRGNPNILGFEIPFNEPHDTFLASEKNWRWAAKLCAEAIMESDPAQLTFTMAPAYGHNNYMPSTTWLPMDLAAGAAPHFYVANGPVPLRSDSQTCKEPWLARDPDAAFSYGQAASFLPFSAAGYPLYNGESGEHGSESLLPSLTPEEAGDRMIEAQFAQGWAAGLSGVMIWTLWEHPVVFTPLESVYRKELQRFAPLFADGARDLTQSPVAFVQDPYAASPVNGHNAACVPFARLLLDLHLGTANYLSDEQWIYQFSHETSTGLEQVDEGPSDVPYKALIVDSRSLNEQATDLIKKTNLPVLWTDDPEKLSAADVTDFLTKAGVTVDTKTPADIELADSPSHLLVYKRAGSAGDEMIYPQLNRAGAFRLVDEQHQTVFEGTATDLAQNGFKVMLDKWHALILTIVDENQAAQK